MAYIGKMIWPNHLAVFYPHPGKWFIGQTAAAGLLLGCVFVLVIRAARRSPYLAVGWLWYVGTLVPVIGIVQVGNQSMADRYTYVPLIGLFIMITWGVAEVAAKWRYRRFVLATSAVVVLTALTLCAWLQIGYWRNSVVLFKHALDVTSGNYLAHYNLGHALMAGGRLEEAIAHFLEVVKINPNLPDAHHNLGLALTEKGKLDKAISHYSEALRIDPNRANTHNDLGIALVRQKKLHEAIVHFSKALEMSPEDMAIRENMKRALEVAHGLGIEDS
jgi:lipoprotein NlpI